MFEEIKDRFSFPRNTAIEKWENEGYKCCVVKHDVFQNLNGYVRLKNAGATIALHLNKIQVHGGVTYFDGRWIGFDTAHWTDYWPNNGFIGFYRPQGRIIQWNKEMVIKETNKLCEEIQQLEKSLKEKHGTSK